MQASRLPGPNTAQDTDGTVTLQVGRQGANGLLVATICAVAVNHQETKGILLAGDTSLAPGTWRRTPTAKDRFTPASFQTRCHSQEQAEMVKAALHHKAIELGDLVVRLEASRP
jgi:hypothetical protein